MRKIVLSNIEKISEYAANIMVDLATKNGKVVFVLASGNTPILTYQLFCDKFKQSGCSPQGIKIILLDEWYGYSFGHSNSCYKFVLDKIISPLSIPMENYLYLKSDCENPDLECKHFQDKINKLSIDLCVLGLGLNGHIGFNEPGDCLKTQVHFAKLSKSSLSHSMAQGYNESIRGGLTLGIKSIFSSKNILLLVSDRKKKKVVNELFSNDCVTSRLPASILHLHSNCSILLDEDANPN